MTNSTKKWEDKAKDFLPNHSIEELESMLKEEKNKIAQKRLNVCILRKKGYTLKQL